MAINAAGIKKVDIFEEVSIKTFKLGKEGIVDSDPLISVSLTINNEYLSSFSYLDSDNVFTMKTTLTPSDAGFLQYIDSLSITNIKGCTIGTVASENSKQNTLSLTIDPTESETKLGLAYSIKTKVDDVGIGTFADKDLSVSFNVEGIRPTKETSNEA